MTTVHALHGFLGKPSDWDLLEISDLKAHQVYSDKDGPWSFAKKFNSSITTSENILMGYSLGGRLALHALFDDPKKWQMAIFISTHPGLTEAIEKQKRIEQDENLSQRFLNQEWTSLMTDWNNQPIFCSKAPPISREEKEYNRNELANQLTQFSLGIQDNFIEHLNEIQIPILWLTGEFDIKFSLLTQQIKLKNPKSKIIILKDAGHRLPWEQKEPFKRIIHAYRNNELE